MLVTSFRSVSLGKPTLFEGCEKECCTARALRCIVWGKRDGWWILRLKWLLG